MRQVTRDAIAVNLRFFALILSIALAGILLLIFYVLDLLDVKLIISLVTLELPTAAFLSYLFGERSRAQVVGAIEYLRASMEFSHIVAYRFAKFWPPFSVLIYFVENTHTKRAFLAPRSVEVLAETGVIHLIEEHKKESKLLEFLRSKGVTFEERRATANDLK